MKALFIMVFALFAVISTSAQTDLLIYKYDNISGKNLQSNKMIMAKEFVFADMIQQFYFDTTTNTLTLQLRGTTTNSKRAPASDNLLVFDIASNKVLWTKLVNYNLSSIEQIDSVIIERSTNNTLRLNNKNGRMQWGAKNTLYYFNPTQKSGVGYPINYDNQYINTVEGIDLKYGRPHWTRTVSREYGWNEVFPLNDSILLVASDGLHSMHLQTGIGWDFEAVTGRKDYTATILTNVLGVVVGVLTGTFITATGADIVRDIASNALVDKAAIYFASRNEIVRLDFEGKTQWKSPLNGTVSKSSIFVKDSFLFMINKGYAFMENRQITMGKPFVSAYNKVTGKPVFQSAIKGDRTQIKTYSIQQDTVILICKNRILKYSLADGSKVADQVFGVGTIGELTGFATDKVYLKPDSTTFVQVSADTSKHYLMTQNENMLVITPKLDILKLINYDQLYYCYLHFKGYRFLAKGDDTVVLDKDNKVVAELKMTLNTKLVGSKLVDVHGSSVVEVDINDVLGE